MVMVNFGPTTLNFGSDFCLLLFFFGTPCYLMWICFPFKRKNLHKWRSHHSWVNFSRSWPRRSLNWLSKEGLGDKIGGRSVRVKLQGKKWKSSIILSSFLFYDFTTFVQCLMRCQGTYKDSQIWNKNSNSDKYSLWTAVETKTNSIFCTNYCR